MPIDERTVGAVEAARTALEREALDFFAGSRVLGRVVRPTHVGRGLMCTNYRKEEVEMLVGALVWERMG